MRGRAGDIVGRCYPEIEDLDRCIAHQRLLFPAPSLPADCPGPSPAELPLALPAENRRGRRLDLPDGASDRAKHRITAWARPRNTYQTRLRCTVTP
jgi:hypothetical protein